MIVFVAPLAGSVDRNYSESKSRLWRILVAPLAGSVDRNEAIVLSWHQKAWVAPLAGSVDRNLGQLVRRRGRTLQVAPLAGSVDRNVDFTSNEIQPGVAPLAGSVDRNEAQPYELNTGEWSRSPRGERG